VLRDEALFLERKAKERLLHSNQIDVAGRVGTNEVRPGALPELRLDHAGLEAAVYHLEDVPAGKVPEDHALVLVARDERLLIFADIQAADRPVQRRVALPAQLALQLLRLPSLEAGHHG